nr:hypothetical protein [Fusobacterium gastrosuis]
MEKLVNEIKKSIKFNLSENEIALLSKYRFDPYLKNENWTENDKKALENIYLKNMIEEKNKTLNIEKEKIEKIISFVSYTRVSENILEELPLQKSLRFFDNIKEIYLLYTEETEKKYDSLKEILEKQKKQYKIIGKKVEDSITEIYNTLRGIAINENAINENTVLEATLGTKTLSIAMYKLAVERDIKVINWKESHLPKYEINGENLKIIDDFVRLPFSSTLEIMQEPIKESIKNYRTINDALKRYEYEIVSNFYKNIGKEDLEFFYKELNKIINFETMITMDFYCFYEKVEIFLKNIFKYKEFQIMTKKKIEKFLIVLTILTCLYKIEEGLENGEEAQELEDRFLKFSPSSFTEYYKIKELFEDEEGDYFYEISQIIYSSILIKYIYKNMTSEDKAKEFIFSSLDKVMPFCKQSELEKIKDTEDIDSSLFKNYDSKKIKKILEILNIEEKLKEEKEKSIKLNGTNLLIEKFELNIDLSKHKSMVEEFSKTKKPKEKIKILMLIFENNFELSKKEWKEKKGKKDISEKTYIKEKSKFNGFIKILNDIVNIELKNKGKGNKDFIIYNEENESFMVDSYFYLYN